MIKSKRLFQALVLATFLPSMAFANFSGLNRISDLEYELILKEGLYTFDTKYNGEFMRVFLDISNPNGDFGVQRSIKISTSQDRTQSNVFDIVNFERFLPTINGGVSISSDDVLIDSFTSTGGSITTAPGGNHSNITLRNLTINNSNGNAIDFGSGGGTLSGNFVFENIELQNSFNAGMLIQNGQAGTTYQGSNVRISDSGGPGLAFLGGEGTFDFDAASQVNNNGSSNFLIGGTNLGGNFNGTIAQNQAGPLVRIETPNVGTINFNGDMNASNGLGIEVDGADGIYNFNGNVTLNGGNAGIDIINGSNGTFTFVDTDITNPGTGPAVNVQNSDANITFGENSSINQGNADSTFFVQNHDVGTITFDGSINATDGDGLQFNDAHGTYDFSGPVVLNGGDAGIDILSDVRWTSDFRRNIINDGGKFFKF